ncbi:hypothetical protein KFK09_027246 [Dendrobium nobile]|uniref:Uncharacterized protein n=1 Tax=Dendrobium nobile TaxID=94219 RepID=A0A8T3A9X6_DENNO|nr:hypothetical protein KFK09_027246 [Dendrobium nobile]
MASTVAATTSVFARSSTALNPNRVHLRFFAPRPCRPLGRFRFLPIRALSSPNWFFSPIEVCVKESLQFPESSVTVSYDLTLALSFLYFVKKNCL